MPSKTLMRASGGFGVPSDSETGFPEFRGTDDPVFTNLEDLEAGRISLGDFVAAEDIPSSVFVNFNASGEVRLAGVTLGRSAMGYVLSSVAAGSSVEVFSAGRVSGLASILRGVTYWLGESGLPAASPPSSGFIQKVGTGIETTVLAAYIEQPVTLA